MRTGERSADQQIDNGGGEYAPDLYTPRADARAVPGPLHALPDEAWEAYRELGFLPVESAISPEQVQDALAGLDRLISGAEPQFRGIQWERGAKAQAATLDLAQRRDHVRKLVYYVDHEPRLHSLAHDPSILATAERLLGATPALFADQALLKPPGIGREKPWHQDLAYFDLRPGAPVVGVWIALDATDADNGCMHVVPGSHRDGPVVHFNRRDFQICDADVQRGDVVAVPLKPGGALVFDGLLHHGTPMNRSRRRRWALQFHYAPAEAISSSSEQRQEYKHQRLAEFGADGKDVTC